MGDESSSDATTGAAPVGSASANRLWGGRFSAGPSPELIELSRSTQFDWRLAPYDIAGSVAHARALHRAGLLTDADAELMTAGLRALGTDVESGAFRPTPD